LKTPHTETKTKTAKFQAKAYLNERRWEPVVVIRLGQPVLHNLLQDAGQAWDQLPAAAAAAAAIDHVQQQTLTTVTL
jgi:hypothetical protein